MRYFLGIESSCDETAVGIFDSQANKVIAHKLFSQIKLHEVFGGVMPETASRSHVEKIKLIFHSALEQAGLSLSDISVVGVTTNPGLFGSLLVGICFAKAICLAKGIEILPIDHNYGHIASSFIGEDLSLKNIPFPFLSLSVSGGHTSIYLVESLSSHKLIANTMDDAAGEVFDKVAKMMGLGYPGGPIIEKLALNADNKDYFKYPRSRDKKSLTFSFSGLKTAVLYHLQKLGVYDSSFNFNKDVLSQEICEKVASSFQVAVADILMQKLELALSHYPFVSTFVLVGGVSCNKYIVSRFEDVAKKLNKQFFFPPKAFCTDNGAMIAIATYFEWQNGKRASLVDVDVHK